MKKYTLQLLKALFTGNNYHRLYAVKIAVLVVLLGGINNAVSAQTTASLSTPTAIAAGNVCPGATNVNIYAFTITGTVAAGANTITAITFNQAGSAASPADIVDYKLWSGAGGGAGTLLGTSTTPGFSGLNVVINNGVATNFWITTDIATTPTTGHTVTVSIMTTGDLTATGPTAGAGTVAGGTQTIAALPTAGGITATPTPLCAGATLTLAATGGVTGPGTLISYNWSGPAGYNTTSATNTKAYVTPNAAASGIYSVTVTYSGAGCTSLPQTSPSVTVNGVPSLPAAMYVCNNFPTVDEQTTLNSGATGGVWSSSNNAVATVDASGDVYPDGAAGTSCVITQVATCGTASTTVTVATRPAGIHGPTGIAGSGQFVCTGSNITLSSATTGGVWSSSFTTIATVVAGGSSNIGIATGSNIAPGSGATTIYYTNTTTGCDTAITLTVEPTPFPITTTAPSFVVCEASQITLNDITDGTTASTWSSSALGIATVTPGPVYLGTPGGVVSGVAGGSTIITYEVIGTGCYVTQAVTVNPSPAPITGSSILCTGQDTTLSDATLGGTWTSLSPSVATINLNSGVAGGVQKGVTNITYTRPVTGCVVTFLLNVNAQPGPIFGPDVVCAGNTIVLSDGIGGGTWSSVHTSIATVDSTTGGVTGQYAGPVALSDSISYDLPTCIAVSYTVTVNPAPGPIVGVASICLGFTTSLSDTTAGGTWANGNPLVDTFTIKPTIRGVTVGGDIITYTLPTACYVLDTILVNPNPDSIKGPDSVCQGAMVTLSDNTLGGTWSSTVFAIARIVDSSGVVTGVSAGGSRISYTLATGCYAVDTFTVKPPVTASVSISKNPPGITCAGTSVTFTANPVNGGIPTYQWYKYTAPVSTNSFYTYTPLVGDVITVMMVAHQSCAVEDTVYDSLAANVYPNGGIVVSISSAASTDSATYLGDVFTFFSNVTYGGSAPTYQWYMNNIAIPGATNSSYSTPVYKDDTFYCQVNGVNPCDGSNSIGTSNGIIIYATYLLGVPQLAATTSDLVLFPNPSNGSIVLSGNVNKNSNDDLNLEVSDMLGHVVYSGKTTPQNGSVRTQIDLNNVATGTYLLHIYSESLNQVFHFVINK